MMSLRVVALAYIGVVFVVPCAMGAMKTENVILITVDGLRHEELFGGLDEILLEGGDETGISNLDALKRKYWRDTPEERREALFPFFWGTLIHEGVVAGNRAANSRVRVTNGHYFSYPGYAEILTGAAQEEVSSNSPIRIKRPTVINFVQNELELPYTGVSAFCSWVIFQAIVSNDPNAFYYNAGYDPMRSEFLTDDIRLLDRVQMDMMTPWDSVRFDVTTFEFALSFLKQHQPRLLYIGLGETDDWAHNKRYDRVINAAHYFDKTLHVLWETLQSIDQYKNKTSIVITTDHGRGNNIYNWNGHGNTVPGSEDIWIAVFGPDTPNDGMLSDTETFTQGQVAATVAKFFGLDYNAFYPDAHPPLAPAFKD